MASDLIQQILSKTTDNAVESTFAAEFRSYKVNVEFNLGSMFPEITEA